MINHVIKFFFCNSRTSSFMYPTCVNYELCQKLVLHLLHGNLSGQGIKHFGLVLWKEVIKNRVICKPNQYYLLNNLGFKRQNLSF